MCADSVAHWAAYQINLLDSLIPTDNTFSCEVMAWYCQPVTGYAVNSRISGGNITFAGSAHGHLVGLSDLPLFKIHYHQTWRLADFKGLCQDMSCDPHHLFHLHKLLVAPLLKVLFHHKYIGGRGFPHDLHPCPGATHTLVRTKILHR